MSAKPPGVGRPACISAARFAAFGPTRSGAVAAGADGLIIEVHNDPQHALTDGAQSITHQQFAEMMKSIHRIAAAVDRET